MAKSTASLFKTSSGIIVGCTPPNTIFACGNFDLQSEAVSNADVTVIVVAVIPI
jgi:hypothetical protein